MASNEILIPGRLESKGRRILPLIPGQPVVELLHDPHGSGEIIGVIQDGKVIYPILNHFNGQKNKVEIR